jgi:hypothetical protein
MTADFDDEIEDFSIHERGWPVERRRIAGHPVMLHYRDVPESDITMLDGIRLTTPLRTVIDLAPDVGMDHLEIMVRDCLKRRLFTAEALAPQALKRRAHERAQCGQVVAALLECDGGQLQRPEQLTGAEVAGLCDLQGTLRIIRRGIHPE